MCSPNAARRGEWEWTAEGIAARASAELGRDVPLAAVGSTLTKLQSSDGLLMQRHEAVLVAGSTKTRVLRFYHPSEAGSELAADLGLPRPDRPGPGTAHGPLPAELVLRVLAALPPSDRARAACVCRAWRGLCATPTLWTDVRCAGLSRTQALGAVARAGAALRSLHAGADVLSCADLTRLLGGGARPALEELTTATTTAESALDFDVPAGAAILAACPALRVLNCRVSLGDGEAEQDGPALQQVCDFLRHPAVHCELLVLGHFSQVQENEALSAALSDALRAQAAHLMHFTACACVQQPWLVAVIAAALPALPKLNTLCSPNGLHTAYAAAMGAMPALQVLQAEVISFEDGALAALAESLVVPGGNMHHLMLLPGTVTTADVPPFNPPSDAAVAPLAAAVAQNAQRLGSFYFETDLDNGLGVRMPLLTRSGAATAHFAAALRRGLRDTRIGPVSAGAAERLVKAAACAKRVSSSLILALSLLNDRAADAAAYAARSLLLLSDEERERRRHERPGHEAAFLDSIALVLDDAALSSCASRDLAATLSEGVKEVKMRAHHLHLCATVTEATATGPVSAAFARAFADGVEFGSIRKLELKILGSWSTAAARAWAQALEALRDDFSGYGSAMSGRVSGLRLLWDSAESCPLCTTPAGARLVRAATELCAECADWPQPFTAAVRCASCASCKLRLPLPTRADHHQMDSSSDDDGSEDDAADDGSEDYE